LRPKKKGSPQSKIPGFDPPRVGKTKFVEPENMESALPMVNFTVSELPPGAEVLAEKLVFEAGQ